MRAVASSPSGGEWEILRALRLARAYNGNDLLPYLVKRHFPKRTTVAELTTLLNAESGTYVHKAAGKFSLTAAGLTRSRQNRPRRWISLTSP